MALVASGPEAVVAVAYWPTGIDIEGVAGATACIRLRSIGSQARVLFGWEALVLTRAKPGHNLNDIRLHFARLTSLTG